MSPEAPLTTSNQTYYDMALTITSENFETLKGGSLPLVVDFWATWCGPCRAVAPILEELAKEYEGRIVIGKCDVEECDDIAEEQGIRNIPTLLFFKDGKEAQPRHVGAITKAKLAKILESLL